MGRAPGQYRAQHRLDGIQLAYVQRPLRSSPPRRSSRVSAAACAFASSISAWITIPSISTAISSSSPVPKAAAPPSPPGIPPTPCPRRCRKSQSRRIHMISRRLDDPLPSSPPHDEQHDGPAEPTHRQIQTATPTDSKALSQMETLARDLGVEHVHHSPIAENANSVSGFPQDAAFMEMAMDNAEGVSKARKPMASSPVERQHDDGHDDHGPSPSRQTVRRNPVPDPQPPIPQARGAPPCLLNPRNFAPITGLL